MRNFCAFTTIIQNTFLKPAFTSQAELLHSYNATIMKKILPPLIPIMVPRRPTGTEKFSLTLTTRSNSLYSASRSGTTPFCCSNGWQNPKDGGNVCEKKGHSNKNAFITVSEMHYKSKLRMKKNVLITYILPSPVKKQTFFLQLSLSASAWEREVLRMIQGRPSTSVLIK